MLLFSGYSAISSFDARLFLAFYAALREALFGFVLLVPVCPG
jgi:hypothetical protein